MQDDVSLKTVNAEIKFNRFTNRSIWPIFPLHETPFSNIYSSTASVLGGIAIGPVSEGVGFKSMGSKGSKSLNSTLTWESAALFGLNVDVFREAWFVGACRWFILRCVSLCLPDLATCGWRSQSDPCKCEEPSRFTGHNEGFSLQKIVKPLRDIFSKQRIFRNPCCSVAIKIMTFCVL